MRPVLYRRGGKKPLDVRVRSQEMPCCAPKAVESEEYLNTVLLQGFHWTSHRHEWYKILQEKAQEIAEAGYTHVWLPPPSHSVSPEGYLPGHLYDLNTKYGSKQELLDAIEALNKFGVKVVADVVINHRCAQMQDENGIWNTYTDDIDHEGNKVNWGKWAIVEGDFGGTGNKDSGEDFHAAPDLDHENPELRSALISWLCFLKNQVGFSGWRFDFAKGFAARFTAEYIVNTVGKGSFCVGEYWNDSVYDEYGLAYDQDAARQQLCDWIDECQACSAAFDYTTKGILQEAVNNQYWRLKDREGKATGLTGWWPDRAVTFIDNHDTGGEQSQWPFPSEKVALGYVYILTHPGIPSVFWSHHFDWDLAQDLKELIALRKRNSITSTSKLHISMADPDCYVAEIGESVLVKLGSRYDLGKGFPGSQWKLVTCGMDYAVWEKKGTAS